MAVDYTFEDPIHLRDSVLMIGDVFVGTGLEITDDDDNAWVLTGQTGVAQVLTEPEGAVLFSPTVTCSGNNVDWTAPATATAGLLPGRVYLVVRVDLPGVGVKTIADQYIELRRGIIT